MSRAPAIGPAHVPRSTPHRQALYILATDPNHVNQLLPDKIDHATPSVVLV